MSRKSMYFRIAICISLLLCIGFIFYKLETSNGIAPHTVDIKMNMLGSELTQQYPRVFTITKKHKADGTFYALDWPKQYAGELHLQHGAHTFTIPNTHKLLAMAMPHNYYNDGIFYYDIEAGLSTEKEMAHEDALHHCYQLINTISNAGWKRFIAPHSPRIKGIQSLAYAQLKENTYPIDPNYKLSLEEWRTADMPLHWQFYADGIHLHIQMNRTTTHSNQHANYIISLAFMSQDAWQRFVVSQDTTGHDWKKMYPILHQQLLIKRTIIEEQLRKEGQFEIDTSYVDHDIN
jgi:hypothetical protein